MLFGASAGMATIRSLADKVCGTNIPILIWGDRGTGKEALARWIHSNSAYSSGEFVKVNCAAIPSTLLESELFGYQKGAFTGANNDKPGRVEMAHGGTLFLDEIADLDLSLQTKLLHFLQDGTFSRIGDQEERRVDARVLCATHKDLEQEIEARRMRADLFYRINGVSLKLPALNERREDIPRLAEYFRLQHEKQFGVKSNPLPFELLEYLRRLPWQGNMRELSNSIARYVLVGPEAAIQEEQAATRTKTFKMAAEADGTIPLKALAREAAKELERNVILESLHENNWNRRKTAKALKISYRALIYKIRDAGLATRRITRQAEVMLSSSEEHVADFSGN